MIKKLKELAELVRGEYLGDGEIEIRGVGSIQEAKEGEITFLANPRFSSLICTTGASAVIVHREIIEAPRPLLRVSNPYLAFAKILTLYAEDKIKRPSPGIHSTCILGKDVKLGKDVSLQAYTVIGDRVEIGDRTVIGAGVYIGDDTRIGKDTLIYPHVTIREEVTVGDRVIIHSGCVIGSDGFGYTRDGERYFKIPQIGTVVIEDDVEIGANTTIDRATLDKTIIKQGTKIDNLVQIAHNVIIGEHSLIIAQVGISGSCIIDQGVIIAGQAGVAEHIKIGQGAIVAAQAGVDKDIPPGVMVSGYPARPHREELKREALMHRLPQLYQRIRALEERLSRQGKKNNPT